MVQHGCLHGSLDTSKYSSPLPIIGVYIAVASLLCFLAMAIDTFKGVWQRKLWFPCKYYSLNAATLTILAIATKLPVDLSSPMPSHQDQLTKLTGSIMICISMGFFMPSLGDMGRNELLSNLIAMSIMTITMVVNVCIQLGTGVIYTFLIEHIIILACNLALLVVLWFSSLTLATSFRDMFDMAYIGIALRDRESMTLEGTRNHLENVWKLAHFNNPQYVLGRSSNCIIVSILCGINMVVLLQAILRSFTLHNFIFCHEASDYGFSTWVVFVAQTIAIVIAGVATTTRWFVIASHVGLERFTTWRDVFQVEECYLGWLRGLKNQHLLSSHNGILLRILQGLKTFVVDALIATQKGIVKMGKFMCFLSVWCAFMLKKLLVSLGCNKIWSNGHANKKDTESISISDLIDMRWYLSFLGETDLLQWTLKHCTRDMERLKNKYGRSVPIHLIKLLPKWSASGTWGQEYHDSLHMVMAMKISMFLSPTNGEHTRLLVNAFNEGLELVYFVEKNSSTMNSVISTKVTPTVWLRRNDLNQHFNKGLHQLRGELKSINTTQVDVILEKLSLFCKESSKQFNDQNLFLEHLEADTLVTIISLAKAKGHFESTSDLSDYFEENACKILSYFLKKLPHAIYKEYAQYPIEKHEERVRTAMFFLCKAQMLQDHIELDWHEINEKSSPSDEQGLNIP